MSTGGGWKHGGWEIKGARQTRPDKTVLIGFGEPTAGGETGRRSVSLARDPGNSALGPKTVDFFHEMIT